MINEQKKKSSTKYYTIDEWDKLNTPPDPKPVYPAPFGSKIGSSSINLS